MITTVIATVIVLGVLIFVHELGHFLLAKGLKVSVLTFSLGFGPRLIGKKIGETMYQVSLVPLGGYVKMVGEETGEKIPPEMMAKSFAAQPVRKRLGIVFAGPLFNFLFAVVAFAAVLMAGMPTLLPEIGEVKPNLPAHQAGIQKGDRVMEVNGTPIQSWEDLAQVIHDSPDRPLNMRLERSHETLRVVVKPQISNQKNVFGDEVQVGLIGVSPSGSYFTQRFDPFHAALRAINQTWQISELTVISIVKIIEGKISAKTIGGPILIAQLAGQQAKAGVSSLVLLMAIISINLVILNLLPIPVVDGWHILMFLIEGAIRKPINVKIRERAQQIGIFIIILIMLLVFYNDLSRIMGVQ